MIPQDPLQRFFSLLLEDYADEVPGVEAIYHRTLESLEAILRRRPFLLGNSPSLADIGFSGPFFCHFGLDPVPAQIMRQQAPAVWEWAARLWNYENLPLEAGLCSHLPFTADAKMIDVYD